MVLEYNIYGPITYESYTVFEMILSEIHETNNRS